MADSGERLLVPEKAGGTGRPKLQGDTESYRPGDLDPAARDAAEADEDAYAQLPPAASTQQPLASLAVRLGRHPARRGRLPRLVTVVGIDARRRSHGSRFTAGSVHHLWPAAFPDPAAAGGRLGETASARRGASCRPAFDRRTRSP